MKAGTIAKLLKGIGLLMLLALTATVLLNWRSIRVEYHVMRLQDARRPISTTSSPARITLKYSLHWARWVLEGRPDRITQQAAGWKHEEALIKLGYCERRVFALTNTTWPQLVTAMTGHRFKDGLLTFTGAGGGEYVVFAAKEDVPFLEETIRETEKKK